MRLLLQLFFEVCLCLMISLSTSSPLNDQTVTVQYVLQIALAGTYACLLALLLILCCCKGPYV